MDSTSARPDRAVGQYGTPARRPLPIVVGRTRERVFLREELAAVGGGGRLVLVGGEAGIGKTTLARDLTRAAEGLGARVLAGSCYDLSNTPPYGPWLDLFDACQRDPDLPTPPSAFAGGRLARIADQAALFAEVRRFFAALAADRPALVLLEDLHWADPASLDLLRHVGPHLRHWPVLLLVTYRGDELTPRRPFAQQFPALVREADGHRLDLRRLDADALRALVASQYHLSQADEDRLVAYLTRHAEGNPFFATEILRTLEEEALLCPVGDHWRLAALDRTIVPSLLRQVIDGRVARLGEETRQPLAIAAVIGQEVPLALWAEVADVTEEGLFDIVEPAVEARLLEAAPDGARVRFVHALTREALYEGILPPRRRAWHRRVAAALMASAHADPDAVAFHLQAADDPRTWEWMERAADRAQRAYAWLTAIERLRTAAMLLAGVVGEERTRGRLLYRLARLHRFSDPAAAASFLNDAERLATRVGDRVLAAEVRYFQGCVLCYSDRCRAGLAQMGEAIATLEAMPLEVTRGDTPTGVWLADALPETEPEGAGGDEAAATLLHAAGLHYRRSTQPWFQASVAQPGAAISVGERYIAVLGDTPGVKGGIRSSNAFAYHGLGIAHAALGRPTEARLAWARSRELFAGYDHHGLIAITLLTELRDVGLTFDAADPPTRRRLATEAGGALDRASGALRPGLSPRLAWLGCLVLDGRWDEADRILEAVPEPGNVYFRREITGASILLARGRGDMAGAWAQIRARLPDGPATEPGDHIHQEGLFLQRLAADLCLAVGDEPSAHDWLAAHDAWLAWSGAVLGRADGRLAWARYHGASGDTVRARSSADEALALATAPDQALVILAARRLLGELETSAGRLGEAEAHLTAALRLADACDAPFERALTLLAIAEARLASGAMGEATALLAEARLICAPLGAAPALARADALAARLPVATPAMTNPSGLTQRERDVLRLLVSGHSNQAIADELFISRDTARTHVANIFRKLEVGTRAEAVDLAHRRGLLSSFPAAST